MLSISISAYFVYHSVTRLFISIQIHLYYKYSYESVIFYCLSRVYSLAYNTRADQNSNIDGHSTQSLKHFHWKAAFFQAAFLAFISPSMRICCCVFWIFHASRHNPLGWIDVNSMNFFFFRSSSFELFAFIVIHNFLIWPFRMPRSSPYSLLFRLCAMCACECGTLTGH